MIESLENGGSMESEEIMTAYLSGVMDGDGSFSLIKRKGKRSPWYVPYLQLGNLSTKIIDLLMENFGGSSLTRKSFLMKSGKMSQPLYLWKIRGADLCKKALERLIPYLVIKKERAEFLLKFIHEHPFERGHIMSKEELAQREKKHLKMISFNEDRDFSGLSPKVSSTVSEDPLFWSYIAGIMDTDGSFCVKRQTQNSGTKGIKNFRYSSVIQVTFADCKVINFIRGKISFGKAYIAENKAAANGYHYTWNISGFDKGIEFLRNVIPYLFFKKENAKILLKFCEGFSRTGFCKAGISSEQLHFREQCYQELVHLNKYGISKPPLIDSDLLKQDNEAQAGNVQGERLSAEDSKEYATV
jgi:hypothetical protein